ncbi:hypothetical protein FOMG_19013 [Fusarium oxysporum f. sp. melonis 26406]|uniref:Uncharacterized protein n=1 Tax=Fusarium oxysporum f. sp. melonis 26406 TaxID=1089452 RepID=W9Z6L2_FUSOX|nr:hypothetical protein FOMG_19013 [Fusarium oxysporum f. sp. melonis 26406]
MAGDSCLPHLQYYLLVTLERLYTPQFCILFYYSYHMGPSSPISPTNYY